MFSNEKTQRPMDQVRGWFLCGLFFSSCRCSNFSLSMDLWSDTNDKL